MKIGKYGPIEPEEYFEECKQCGEPKDVGRSGWCQECDEAAREYAAEQRSDR